MAQPKAKSRSAKGATKAKTAESRRGRKPSRDWSRIKAKWFASPLNLDAFIRANKLARSTARNYLSTKEKNAYIKAAAASGSIGFRQSIIDAGKKENGRLYVAAMKRVHKGLEEIFIDAAARFKDGIDPMGEAAAGRLAIEAGRQLVTVSSELQGVPKEEDGFGWPLTKGFVPFRYQRDFIHDSPAQVKLETGGDAFVFAFIGGVGSGKTYCGAQKFGQVAWENRGRLLGVFAPTYKMLEDATKLTFFEVLRQKGISYRYVKSDNYAILFGDTKVLFRSMDDPDLLRGPNLAAGWIDEGGQVKSREAYDVIQARIRDPEAPAKQLQLTSTPDGLNWLYEVLVTEAEANKVKLYRGRTADNPVLGDYYERLHAVYDPRFAKQELEAEFLNIFAGQAYWNFSPTESVIKVDSMRIDRNADLSLCCDFNVSPMCWNIAQDVRTRGGEIYTYFLEEMHLDTAGTQVAADEFVDRYSGHKGTVLVYGDATGRSRHTSATRSDYEIIEKTLKRAKLRFELRIGTSNPRESDRIAAVNARLLDARRQRKLFISEACKYTLIDLERVGFKPGTRQLDKNQGNLTHHTDAIGYKVNYDFPVRGMEITQQRRQHYPRR
jgi:hypothetical protein